MSTPMGSQTDFLTGGGSMGELIRSFDWSRTALGSPDGWSPALRTMVGILLANRFPLLLWWGPEYVSIYNDAYRPILGQKHPWGLGRAVRECWSEIWHVIGPLIDTPFNGGPATWIEDLELEINRAGFFEETHFTVAYSPVPDGAAPRGIGGVLATVHEITEKIIGQRRVLALRDLASAAEAKSAKEACANAAASLAKYTKDIPFALLYLTGADDREASLAAAAGIETSPGIAPPLISLQEGEGGGTWPLRAARLTGEMQVVENLSSKFEAVPSGPWTDPPHCAVVVPVRANMVHQFFGFFVAGVSSRLRLDDSYQDFLKLATSQIATAIGNAQAYEQERRRAEALAEIDRAKTVFFSNVSHEFRTPLTLMLGPLEEMLRNSETVPPEHRNQLATAHRNSLRLQKLVNSLLDFSRIEAGRIQATYTPLDLASLTADLCSNFRAAMEAAGLRFEVDCSPLGEPVYVDREMWEKIVLNLLSNAFKFTFEGQVTVRLEAIHHHAVLTVSDTGVGMPAAELPKVFERFHRVEGSRGRTFEGTGIGLALVQELVKLHGGTIQAQSRFGEGATFTVSLPFGSAHLPPDRVEMPDSDPPAGIASTAVRAEAFTGEALTWIGGTDLLHLNPAAPEARRPATDRLRVLLADDNSDMRDYMAHILGSQYDLVAVPDGREALAAARRLRPDLVLSDIMMPQLDGFGLLREIRADAQLRDVPVIFLSARAGEEARTEGVAAGADDYLTKPFSARELVARVRTHIQMAQWRKQTESALRESEARFRALATASSEVVYRMSADWTEMRSLVGREFIADTPEPNRAWLGKYIHPDDQPKITAAIENAIRTKSMFELEHRVIRVNGTLGWTLSRAMPIFDEAGSIKEWFGTAKDVTEHKEAEEKLRETQKLESLGVLAGGIAHDFNNLLTGVLGNASLLAEDLKGSELARMAEDLIESSERMARLTQQMLAYSGQGRFIVAPLDLTHEISRIVALLQASVPKHVEVRLMLASDLPIIEADASQIQQVIMNLVINAAEAIEGHPGVVEIITTVEELPPGNLEGNLLPHSGAPGRYAVLSVTDNGCGMDEQTKRKIFDPFFTTKFTGRGLGLSAVLGIVRGHKGLLTVRSARGRGSTFKVFFPVTREVQKKRHSMPTRGGARRATAGTVLVVDDEHVVLRTATVALEKAGYGVLTAGNGRQALEVFQARRHEIIAVVLDLTMPFMGGAETLQHLRELDPNVLVVGSSGYDEVNATSRFGTGVTAFLQKPYTADAMASKIALVLQGAQARLDGDMAKTSSHS
jgi:signal transduction histidine kinase/DNA-binding response OmpR family regulator